MPDEMGGFSRLQTSTLALMVFALLIGLAIQVWQTNQPLPQVDPALEKRFIAISDSLAALQKTGSEAGPEAMDISVYINTASPEELQMLPGVGPVLANRIWQYRKEHGRFKAKTELLHVKGIGKKTLEKLSAMIIIN